MQRFLILFLSLFFIPLAWAVDVSMLTPEKRAVLAQKAAAIEAGERRLKYDWVGELSLSASATESKGAGSDESALSQQAGIGFSQDLFRSGGITGSIRYASQWARIERLALEQEQNGYLEALASMRLQYEQDRLRLLQNEHQLKNSEITLFIKRQQYEAGETDITQLNDALRERNALQKTRLELKNTLANRRLELAKLTLLDPESIALPFYDRPEKETFLNRHLPTRLALAQSDAATTQQGLTASSYLPTLSATANYGYQQNEGFAADGDSYSAGLRLVMPLSFTAKAAWQEKRAEALRARSWAQAAKEEAAAFYDQSAGTLANTQERIALLKENIRLYDQLIVVTDRAVQSGERSRYDLQMLENTRAIDDYEIRIHEIALLSERAKLYFAMTQSKAFDE